MSAVTDPTPATRERASERFLTWVLLALAGAVVLGVLAGVLWWQVVTPAYFQRVGNEVVMTQRELADRYRAAVDDRSVAPAEVVAAVQAIDRSAEALVRNANETLLLQGLLLRLPNVPA